jgi:hypothetical protein
VCRFVAFVTSVVLAVVLLAADPPGTRLIVSGASDLWGMALAGQPAVFLTGAAARRPARTLWPCFPSPRQVSPLGPPASIEDPAPPRLGIGCHLYLAIYLLKVKGVHT